VDIMTSWFLWFCLAVFGVGVAFFVVLLFWALQITDKQLKNERSHDE